MDSIPETKKKTTNAERMRKYHAKHKDEPEYKERAGQNTKQWYKKNAEYVLSRSRHYYELTKMIESSSSNSSISSESGHED